MDESSQRLSRTIWIGISLLMVILCVNFLLSRLQPRLVPVAPPPVLGQVADFTLTNQAGAAVSLADLRGHVWVADIIFTRCAGPCPRMTQQMKELQDAPQSKSATRFVTLTTDPDFDTPQILKVYGERFGADSNRWTFLTGTKTEIAALAINSLKLTAIEKKPEERKNTADLFIHSTIFVVVDKQARLRGVFQTTGDGIDPADVHSRIVALVRQLQSE